MTKIRGSVIVCSTEITESQAKMRAIQLLSLLHLWYKTARG